MPPEKVYKFTVRETKSKRLKWHRKCVADKLKDKEFPSRTELREAFSEASKVCKEDNPYK